MSVLAATVSHSAVRRSTSPPTLYFLRLPIFVLLQAILRINFAWFRDLLTTATKRIKANRNKVWGQNMIVYRWTLCLEISLPSFWNRPTVLRLSNADQSHFYCIFSFCFYISPCFVDFCIAARLVVCLTITRCVHRSGNSHGKWVNGNSCWATNKNENNDTKTGMAYNRNYRIHL